MKKTIFASYVMIMFLLLSINLKGQDWLYLGQDPPGTIPERFPPDPLLANAEWWWHSPPIFSPAGDEMFFVKYYAAQYMEMLYMRVENNEWTEPEAPSFANPDYEENCPFFSMTGDTLYFVSTRPEGWYFMSTKENDEWTEPISLGIPYPVGSFLGWQFAINKNKDFYFEIWENNQCDIYCSRYINGNYQTPQMLPAVINTDFYEFAAYIDPDDNFIIFSSNRPGSYGFNDIYISSKDINGNWTEAINLGPTFNSSNEEAFPFISYDNLYFFFNTRKAGDLGRNPYWVDAQVIFDMVMEVNEEIIIPQEIGLSNYPNPFNPETVISYQLPENSEVELIIYNIKGQKVKTLVREVLPAGEHFIIWNGRDSNGNQINSGIYFYKLRTDNFEKIKKMMLLK